MAAVSIIIPSYHDLAQQTRTSLTMMVHATQCYCGDHEPWLCTRGKHDIIWLPQLGSCVIHWARNQMISLALHGPTGGRPGRPPSEYFLLMDDDMLVEKHYLTRLLQHKKDIVSGICTVRRDPPVPTIRFWSKEQQQYLEPFEWDWHSQKLMEVDANGAAFMLVKRKVLEAMKQAYFECKFEREADVHKGYDKDKVDIYWNAKSALRRKRFDGASGGDAWKQKDCWWFEFLDNVVPMQWGELGEDLSFCWKVKQLGYRIWADPQILPGHIGIYGYSVTDYHEWVERRKNEGRTAQVQERDISVEEPETTAVT